MTDHNENVVRFPAQEDAGFDRIKVEAERLANQSETERSFFLPKRAQELGIDEQVLKKMVRAVLIDRSNATAAEVLEEDRKRKQQEAAHAAEVLEDQRLAKQVERERKQQEVVRKAEEKRLAKEEEKNKRQAEKAAEQERKAAEKVAAQKINDKAKGFSTIAKLPVARQEPELTELADRLSEDIEVLRSEFEAFAGVGRETENTEPWSEPVVVNKLLDECAKRISQYVVLAPAQLTTATLWTAHCWLYDHGVPIHSPILAMTSAEPDAGKSTLAAVLGRMVPRFSFNVEMTGPSLYRFVDAIKPTLVIDEADDLFVRKSDLRHIINAGWTRGTKIPRQVSINGIWQTVHFDPFTPKAIALIGRGLPPNLRTRCIELRMLPKRPDERVEAFALVDDTAFGVLRRQFARFAVEHAAALKAAQPSMPSSMNNRAAANWKLLIAIADLAGGAWPQRAREAMERLSRSGRQPSDGVQLLTALKVMFSQRTEMFSADMVTELKSDPTSLWADYNHGGPVTQRQVAHLLDAYDIRPQVLHMKGSNSKVTFRGYKREQFADDFARYLTSDPNVRTSPKPKKRKRSDVRFVGPKSGGDGA